MRTVHIVHPLNTAKTLELQMEQDELTKISSYPSITSRSEYQGETIINVEDVDQWCALIDWIRRERERCRP